MRGVFAPQSRSRHEDGEAAGRVRIDFRDDRWQLDLNLHNIITRISKQESWQELLRAKWHDIIGEEKTYKEHEKACSYRIHFVVLQRIYLTQLREKLARRAVDLRFKARPPSGWTDTLREYIQALQDYDYMEKRSLLPRDPFYVSGERYLDRMLLKDIVGGRGEQLENETSAVGHWESEATEPPSLRDTRRDNYHRSWTHGFHRRIGVAAVAGAFLIAPMWLMVLHNTLYTALVSTTVFVAVFGLMSAIYINSHMEVMSPTAAYAAVLVVFVGLTTETSRKDG
ncbi:hypothetical protein C8A03DRAFT_16269 [Achaetomium macrosporum]|uniref:DUF6594 domain-containing protein n=1 Tax=Achaetomium macrosporum TaxID=79813 RepID=A0AAN7C8E3_9PEZI|nr:hypothetical protein C8A03DRAFT_16269 [Achaetomium macrosporum]